MRLFNSPRKHAADGDDERLVNLMWCYEISNDGGKTWRLEGDRVSGDQDLLRRGVWVAPPLN